MKLSLSINPVISSSKFLLVLLLISIALIPTLIGPIRLEDIIIVFILVVLFIQNNLYIKINNYNFILSVLLVSFISIIIGFFINYKSASIRDLVSWIKILKYAAVFIVIRYSSISKEISIQTFLKTIINVGLISSFIGLFQYFNVFDINSWLTHIYDDNAFRLSFLIEGLPGRRIIGTSFSPNYFAMFEVILILGSFILAKYYRNKKYWFFMLFFGIILLLSKSRTGLIAISFSLAMSYIFGLYIKKRFSLIILIAGLFIGSFVLIINIADRPPFGKMAFFQRFKKSQFDLNQTNSLSVRLAVWEEFLDWFKNHPEAWVFGAGPQKNKGGQTLDSEYFELLRSMGIVGFLLIIFLELYILYKSLKIYTSSIDIETKAIAHYTVLLFITLFSYNLMAKMMADIQNISLLLITCAFFFRKHVLNSTITS